MCVVPFECAHPCSEFALRSNIFLQVDTSSSVSTDSHRLCLEGQGGGGLVSIIIRPQGHIVNRVSLSYLLSTIDPPSNV